MKKFLFSLLLPLLVTLNSLAFSQFEFPELKDWTKTGEEQRFNPENLFDFINGASGLFINYNFQQLQVMEYQHQDEVVRVEVYDHGNPVQAFGMYSQERSEDMPFVEIGAQGYTIETILNFVKGPYYVKLNYYGDQNSREALMTVASQVADKMGGKDELPTELDYFPTENKIANAEQFIALSFMGLSFIDQVFTARYQEDGQNYLLFYHEAEPEKIKEELMAYYEFAKKPQKNLKQGKHLIEDPYNGPMTMIWEGNKLYGVNGLDNKKQAQQMLDQFKVNIK